MRIYYASSCEFFPYSLRDETILGNFMFKCFATENILSVNLNYFLIWVLGKTLPQKGRNKILFPLDLGCKWRNIRPWNPSKKSNWFLVWSLDEKSWKRTDVSASKTLLNTFSWTCEINEYQNYAEFWHFHIYSCACCM